MTDFFQKNLFKEYFKQHDEIKRFKKNIKEKNGAFIAFAPLFSSGILSAILYSVFHNSGWLLLNLIGLISVPLGIFVDFYLKDDIKYYSRIFKKNPYKKLAYIEEELKTILTNDQFKFEFLYNLKEYRANILLRINEGTLSSRHFAESVVLLEELYDDIKQAFIENNFSVSIDLIRKLDEEYLQIEGLYDVTEKNKHFDQKFQAYCNQKEGVELELEHVNFQERLKSMI